MPFSQSVELCNIDSQAAAKHVNLPIEMHDELEQQHGAHRKRCLAGLSLIEPKAASENCRTILQQHW